MISGIYSRMEVIPNFHMQITAATNAITETAVLVPKTPIIMPATNDPTLPAIDTKT